METESDGAMAQKHLIEIDGVPINAELEVQQDGDSRVRLAPDMDWQTVELLHIRAGLHVVMVDNVPIELYIERNASSIEVTIGSRKYQIRSGLTRLTDRGSTKSSNMVDGLAIVRASMTGAVLEIRVGLGEQVEAGEVLVVVESMKMNNELRAPVAGVVKRIVEGLDSQLEEGEEVVAILPTETPQESS